MVYRMSILTSFENAIFTETRNRYEGMTGLQSGNIIGEDPPRTNVNASVV